MLRDQAGPGITALEPVVGVDSSGPVLGLAAPPGRRPGLRAGSP
jgi:hypothetical protein